MPSPPHMACVCSSSQAAKIEACRQSAEAASCARFGPFKRASVLGDFRDTAAEGEQGKMRFLLKKCTLSPALRILE